VFRLLRLDRLSITNPRFPFWRFPVSLFQLAPCADDDSGPTVRFSSIDKAKALALIVHSADISHPAKTWSLHFRWTEQLIEEFFRQVRSQLQVGPVSGTGLPRLSWKRGR